MKNGLGMFLIAFVLTPTVRAQDADKPKAAETKKDEEAKSGLGMSIVGNHEAPKALVLVPWKPSEPGKAPEMSTKIEASANPVDKEVFIRILQYQQIVKATATSRSKQ